MSGTLSGARQLPEPGRGFAWADGPVGPVLRCTALEASAAHLFTTKSVDVRHHRTQAVDVWATLADVLAVSSERLVRVAQVHGGTVLVVRADTAPRRPRQLECDGLLTDDASLGLAVVAADCVPILLAHGRSSVVGVAHAGWRGTAAGIARQLVQMAVAEFSIDAAELIAAIGPSIGPCCYRVGPDVREAFASVPEPCSGWQRWFRTSDDGVTHLDLWAANRDQLIDAGLGPSSVHLAGLCTVTHAAVLHSHRAHGAGAGRMAAVIRALGGHRPGSHEASSMA